MKKIHITGLSAILSVILALGILNACSSNEKIENFVLEEDTGFLQIPGVGWQTFFRTADKDPSMNGLPFRSGLLIFAGHGEILSLPKVNTLSE